MCGSWRHVDCVEERHTKEGENQTGYNKSDGFRIGIIIAQVSLKLYSGQITFPWAPGVISYFTGPPLWFYFCPDQATSGVFFSPSSSEKFTGKNYLRFFSELMCRLITLVPDTRLGFSMQMLPRLEKRNPVWLLYLARISDPPKNMKNVLKNGCLSYILWLLFYCIWRNTAGPELN